MQGLHVAIIMDGNGRWANARGLARTAGHRAGATAVRRVVESCPDAGVGTLTLYALSSDNWRRPESEVRAVLGLVAEYLEREVPTCLENGVRVSVIGRRDRIPPRLRRAIRRAERATRACGTVHLRVALDYSSRDAIVAAASALRGAASRTALARHLQADSPDVDLLVRTGGEQRLSDFLLWECAYAELLFLPQAWPDFRPDDLKAAVDWFQRRERRFGGIPAAPAREDVA